MPNDLVISSAGNDTDALLRSYWQSLKRRADAYDEHGEDSPEWEQANTEMLEIKGRLELLGDIK